MTVTEIIERIFERELQELRFIFGPDSKQVEIAEEDGPMSWEEAMQRPMEFTMELDIGGGIEFEINKHNTPIVKGGKIYK